MSKIPAEDVLGVTVVLVTCSFKSREFIRVGYYVNNSLKDPPPEGEEPPKTADPKDIVRTLLADKPRVTRFPIEWT